MVSPDGFPTDQPGQGKPYKRTAERERHFPRSLEAASDG
jgi:hypothetical protein